MRVRWLRVVGMLALVVAFCVPARTGAAAVVGGDYHSRVQASPSDAAHNRDHTMFQGPDGELHVIAHSGSRGAPLNYYKRRAGNPQLWTKLNGGLTLPPMFAGLWAPHVVFNPGDRFYYLYATLTRDTVPTANPGNPVQTIHVARTRTPDNPATWAWGSTWGGAMAWNCPHPGAVVSNANLADKVENSCRDPFVLKDAAGWHLFYTGKTRDYTYIGHALAPNPWGPWTYRGDVKQLTWAQAGVLPGAAALESVAFVKRPGNLVGYRVSYNASYSPGGHHSIAHVDRLGDPLRYLANLDPAKMAFNKWYSHPTMGIIASHNVCLWNAVTKSCHFVVEVEGNNWVPPAMKS